MPAFGRIGKHHNRSQQALVEPVVGAPSTNPNSSLASATASASAPAPPGPSSGLPHINAHGHIPSQSQSHSHTLSHSLAPAPAPASSTSTATTPTSAVGANNPITPHSASSTAFSSSESFDIHNQQLQQHHQQQQHQLQQLQHQQLQGQQGPPPPPHDYPASASAAAAAASRNSLLLQHNPLATDSRQRGQGQQEFADSVSRSQSQRYTPAVAPYPNTQYGAASSSVDNLRAASLSNTSPAPGQTQATSPVPQPAPAPEKRSARRLLKNILSGASRDHHHNAPPPPPPSQPTPPGSYDNTGGLARRPSKRVSKPPPARTALSQQPSQLSLDQQSTDWPLQAPNQQPSPLQGVGEIEEQQRFAQDPNRDHRLQTPDSHRHSIRYVPSDLDNTPYEDPAYHQQQQQQLHALEQNHLAQQAAYDPSQQQQQQQQYQQQFSQQQRGQYQAGPSPIYTGHLGTGSHQNPETVSQLSHESPVTDSDARSANVQSAQTSPAVKYAVQTTDNPLPPTIPPAQGTSQAQQQNMAPPAGGPPPRSERRPQAETEKALRSQVDAPAGPPPSYRQGPNMPTAAAGGNPTGYRTSSAQDGRQFEGAAGEQGRNSPQPSNPDRDGNDPDKFKELLTKYKNVKRLYFDGKTQIDNLNSQIEQLQNAVANQRMSQSRTALDDSEYITRFNRLNGAINNLSFNIRKDWRTVPQWLDMYVSIDALKTGKQEMTAVGRAVITRWIVEEIFNKCFHPGLNFDLSRQLKEIELNIRRFSYTMNSQEEFDALTNKVVSWRMATLEGLQMILNSPESADNRADFTRMCTTNLTATLFQYMTDPPPAGVDGSASMIVELAVGIAANLPLESRDVAINYPLPGDQINPNIMEVEKAPLPPLESQKEGEGEAVEESDKDKNGKDRRADKTRSGMFTTILGGGPPRKGSNASSIVPTSTDAAPTSALPPKDNNKVRLAGFPAVEVRGRQVLVKAPVWTL